MAPSTPQRIKTAYADFSYSTPSPRKNNAKRSPKNQTTESTQNLNSSRHARTVYLIRHGQSLGQKANKRQRQSDPNLIDCGLSHTGVYQAEHLMPQLLKDTNIQLLVTSPLTRAVQTTMLAFAQKTLPTLIAYDLREIGSPIPENQPRPLKEVFKDLDIENMSNLQWDFTSLAISPETVQSWPKKHDTPPKVVRRDRVRKVFGWLAQELPSEVREIAVVCHYHVIRNAVSDPYDSGGSPRSGDSKQQQYLQQISNAQPIECRLHSDGRLEFVRLLDGDSDEKVSP